VKACENSDHKCGEDSSAGLTPGATRDRPLQHPLDPLPLQGDTVLGCGRAPDFVRTWKAGSTLQRAYERVLVYRVDEHAGSGWDELGRAADARRHHTAPAGHRLEQRLPKGLDQTGLAEDVAGGEPGRYELMRNATEHAHARDVFQLAAQRPVAEEDERALAKTLEGARQPDHVLALRQRAGAEKERLLSLPTELAPGLGLVAWLGANAYLLGREYFELAAMRFHSAVQARELRRRHAGFVFVYGAMIAVFVAIPLLNLLTPLFATTLMVRLHKRIARAG